MTAEVVEVRQRGLWHFVDHDGDDHDQRDVLEGAIVGIGCERFARCAADRAPAMHAPGFAKADASMFGIVITPVVSEVYEVGSRGTTRVCRIAGASRAC